MLRRHVIPQLVAYCHGELPEGEAARVAEHLERCARCRAECDVIRRGAELGKLLPRAPAPPRLWSNIEASLDQAADRPAGPVAASRRAWWTPRRVTASLAVGVLALALGLALHSEHSAGGAWEVAGLAGAPRVGSSTIGREGRLRVGQWLETDASSRARLQRAGIGHVDIDPNTRVGLLAAGDQEHRLSLARGTMHALITAPPRLFFVDTPSAVAVDLGCSYTLHVDRTGRGRLTVDLGWVAFEWNGRESIVPAGGACETRPDGGPGTPYFEDAPPALRDALSRFDFEHGGEPMLREVLATARSQDAFTLWNLLSRVEAADRAAVYDRMAQLLSPPNGASRAGALRLDSREIDRWRDRIEDSWWK